MVFGIIMFSFDYLKNVGKFYYCIILLLLSKYNYSISLVSLDIDDINGYGKSISCVMFKYTKSIYGPFLDY